MSGTLYRTVISLCLLGVLIAVIAIIAVWLMRTYTAGLGEAVKEFGKKKGEQSIRFLDLLKTRHTPLCI